MKLYTIFAFLLIISNITAQVKSEISYEPDSTIIDLESVDFSGMVDELNTMNEDYYKSWDTLHIRRTHRDMTEYADSVRLVFDKNFHPPFIGPVISNFGPRGKRIHTGVDIRLNQGDTVYAAFDGVVRISRVYSGYGHMVLLRHDNGLETVYAHFSKRLVGVNDTVKAGQPIGLGGRTGRATCNHLHFETRIYGEPVNPNLIINFTTHSLKDEALLVKANTFNLGKKVNPSQIHAKQPGTYAQSTSSHKIQQGDTLYSLARKYKTSVKRICELNKITETSILRIGQVIKLPVN